jgi:predicted  nucleic acid-binding Zn-ribbon protein
MTTTLELHKAQQALADAQAAHEREEREQKIKLLGDLHQQQESSQTRFDELERNLRTEDETRIRLRHRVRELQSAIEEHAMAKPAIADYLKTDKGVVRWQRENDRLTAALADAEEKLKQVPQSDRLEYVRLGHELGTLQYRIQNLVDALNGSLGRVPKGGLFEVA